MVALKTLRNHWKKSLFATSVAGYGLYYVKTSFDISQHMKNVCAETVTMGKICEEPKHVLVVLNPAANKRKAEKMFKEYCEPILHLAGYRVDIIKTTQEGHVKTWLNDMTVRPHAIVVAGGDGTASEVVTGLLRRKEGKCPIVILPLGRKSATALKYLDLKPENKLQVVKSLTAALTPLLQEKVKNESVLKVDFINDITETADTRKENTSIYGLNDFSWGFLRDIESVTDKYWYFGPLRQYAAAFFSAFSNKFNWKIATDYMYTPPCSGCRNCQPYENKSYVKKFLPRMYKVKDTNTHNNANSYKLNEDCDTITKGHTNVNQLNITCKQNVDSTSELETKMIDALIPGFDFVKKIKKVIGKELEPNSTIKSRIIQLQPTDENATTMHYSIDGEEYDARPLRVEVIPNGIQVFCN